MVLPPAVGFTEVFDTLFLTDSLGYRIARRSVSLRLRPDATQSQIDDLFERFQLEVVGTLGTGRYRVFFPDPGPDLEAYDRIVRGLEAHPAVDLVNPLGGSVVID